MSDDSPRQMKRPYATTFRAQLTRGKCSQCGATRTISSVAVLRPDGEDTLPEGLCLLITCECGVTFPLPMPSKAYEPTPQQLADAEREIARMVEQAKRQAKG